MEHKYERKISATNNVLIPVEAMRILCVYGGDPLEFTVNDGEDFVTIRKAKSNGDE